MSIEVTQVWLATSIKYDKLPRSAKPEIIDELMDIKGVAEVCHHNDILVLMDIDDDESITEEVSWVKSQIKMLFNKYNVSI